MAVREDESVLGDGGNGLVVDPRRWKALFGEPARAPAFVFGSNMGPQRMVGEGHP